MHGSQGTKYDQSKTLIPHQIFPELAMLLLCEQMLSHILYQSNI